MLLKFKKAFGVFILLSAVAAVGITMFLLLIDGKGNNFATSEVEKLFSRDQTDLVQPESLIQNHTLGVNYQKRKSINSKVGYYDSRAFVFDKYFEKFDSPLTGYGRNFVYACDRYGAPYDCLLMVAIAKAETDLCKTGISHNQKNCWGFGGSGENRIVYPSYEVAIDEVTRRIMVGYGTRFFEDARNGQLYYCGSHCTKWGDVVNSYKSQINLFGVDLGFSSLI